MPDRDSVGTPDEGASAATTASSTSASSESDPSIDDRIVSESSPEPAETAGQQMPDPITLMAMAAMHIPTQELVRTLISVFDAHAWRSMGLVADHTGEVKKDLPSAQLSIDCLAFLLGKIEGTLEETERRDVQRRLMDLRTNYLAKMREA